LSKQRQKIWERKFALKYTDVNIERVQLSLNLSMQRNKDFFENWFSRSTSSDSWSNNLRRKNLIFYSCRSTNLEFVLKGTAQTFYTKFWKPNHWFNEKFKKVWIRPNADLATKLDFPLLTFFYSDSRRQHPRNISFPKKLFNCKLWMNLYENGGRKTFKLYENQLISVYCMYGFWGREK
jgi:hypothetical protein